MGAAGLADARAARGERAVDDAVLRNDAGEVHLRHDLDDGRAADAGDAEPLGVGVEARLVRPQIRPDDLEARLERGGVDADALDGAGRGALAGRDLRALEGGACRRGGGHDAVAVAEDDLGIGADVDEQHHAVLPVRAFRQRRPGGIRPDMAGDAGQHVDARAGVDAEPQVARPGVDGAGDGEREGCLAELGRVDAEEQMVHDRVADDDGVEHVVGIDAALGADLARQLGDGIAHRLRQLGAAVGVHHHVGNAAHQILAEADLRVLHARRGDDAPRQQRHQMHGDGGGADVAGDAVGLVVEARPERDDVGSRGFQIAVDRRRHAPFALAQDALHLRDEILRDEQVVPAPILVQHRLEAVEIAERLVHVGFVDLDIAELDGGVALDDAVDGRLAHHLGIDHRVLRHVDDEVALDGGRAGQAPVLRQPAHAVVALLLGAAR